MLLSDNSLMMRTTDPRWDAAASALTNDATDTYFTTAYHTLCEVAGDGIGVATLADCGGRQLFVPGMRVAIPGTDRWDIQSCNGYGGPLASPGSPTRALDRGWREWIEASRTEGAVAAFFRMHPLVENVQWLPADAVVRADRETVYVPLDRGIADAWERAGSRHRNMVNRGRKTGTTIEWNTPALWDTFVPLYRSAMGRLSAPSRLNFGSEYFATLRMIPGAEIVGTTDSDGLVSAAIFLFGPRWAHYHLAARREDAPNFAANLLVQAGIERAAKLELAGVHLGGGVTHQHDDPLLRFKRSVGGETRQFHTARVVIDVAAFNSLSAAASSVDAANWLLPYRHPSARPI